MSMICRYETTVIAKCPVDDKVDIYQTTFLTARAIQVEGIIEAIAKYKDVAKFQEDITAELAKLFNCKVTTVGFHSGVRTTVEVQ